MTYLLKRCEVDSDLVSKEETVRVYTGVRICYRFALLVVYRNSLVRKLLLTISCVEITQKMSLHCRYSDSVRLAWVDTCTRLAHTKSLVCFSLWIVLARISGSVDHHFFCDVFNKI